MDVFLNFVNEKSRSSQFGLEYFPVTYLSNRVIYLKKNTALVISAS